MGEDIACHAGDRPGLDDQVGDPVAKEERDVGVSEDAFGIGAHDAGAGAPGYVKARQGIAMARSERAAAFRPSDDGKPTHSEGVEIGAHRTGSEIEISFGPLSWHRILGPVEAGGTVPVGAGKRAAVAQAEAALFGCVDHEEATKAPPRLPAERLRALHVEQGHLAAAFGGVEGGDKARQARAEDEDVMVHAATR